MNQAEIVETDEVTLLDLLVVIAENLKLLVVGPVVMGIFALAITYALPQSFTSEAILALPRPVSTLSRQSTSDARLVPAADMVQAASMMASPIVLDPVIEALKLSQGRSIQSARAELASRVRATVGKEGLLRLEVTASTPMEAQSISNAVIDSWLIGTVPSAQDRADLEVRLANARASLAAVQRLLSALSTEGTASLGKPLTRGEAGTSVVAVGELQARYLDESLVIPRLLQGLSRNVVRQSPTLPTDASAPRKGLIVMVAVIGSAGILFLWAVVGAGWRRAARNPQVAVKQAKVLVCLGLRRRPE